jgi:hypothetical protein
MHYSTSTAGCTLWLALGVGHHSCDNGHHRDPATGRPIGEPLTADTFVVLHGLQFSSRRSRAVRNSAFRSQGSVGGERRDYGSVRSSGPQFVSQPDQIPDGWIDVVGPVRRDRPLACKRQSVDDGLHQRQGLCHRLAEQSGCRRIRSAGGPGRRFPIRADWSQLATRRWRPCRGCPNTRCAQRPRRRRR